MTNFRFKRWSAVSVIVIVALALGAWLMISGNRQNSAETSDQSLVGLGQQVYADNCASCHGINLEGQSNWKVRDKEGYMPAPPHDESGHTWHHADELLFKITKFGTASLLKGPYKTNMNGYQDILSDREIWAVLAFIKSRWPANIRDRQASLNK